MKYPFRNVTEVKSVAGKGARRGEGCYLFTLECGHKALSKRSNGRPKRKRCRDCGLS